MGNRLKRLISCDWRSCPSLLFAAPASIHAVTIATVPVGNPGNGADMQVNAVGSVDYEFDIGAYEVTNAQYVDFLNDADPAGTNLRGLYSSQMSSDARGGITFSTGAANGFKYSAKAGRASNPGRLRLVVRRGPLRQLAPQWPGAGNTEDGSYQLTGGMPIPTNGDFVSRKVTASWCLPSIDEWHKAAYHKNDGVTAQLLRLSHVLQHCPASDQPPGSVPNATNSANFSPTTISSTASTTATR